MAKDPNKNKFKTKRTPGAQNRSTAQNSWGRLWSKDRPGKPEDPWDVDFLPPGTMAPQDTPEEEPEVEEPEEEDTTPIREEADEPDAPPEPPEDDEEFSLSPPDLDSLSRRIKPAEDLPDLEQKYQDIDWELKNNLARASQAYVAAKDKASRGELWEGIIHGLAHIFAGVYGMENDLNVGGLKFQKKNWEAVKGRLNDELRTKINKANVSARFKKQLADREYDTATERRMYETQLMKHAVDQAWRKLRAKQDFQTMKFREWQENNRQYWNMVKAARQTGNTGSLKELKNLKKEQKEVEKLVDDWIKTHQKQGESDAEPVWERLQKKVGEYEQAAKALSITPAWSQSDFKEKDPWFWSDGILDPDEALRQARERVEGPATETEEETTKPAAPPPKDTFRMRITKGENKGRIKVVPKSELPRIKKLIQSGAPLKIVN